MGSKFLLYGNDLVYNAGILANADAKRKAEFEKWLSVSTSTDHDDAADFLQTPMGKAVLGGKS